MSSTISYGDDFTFEVSAMPIASAIALMSRGLAHVLGNEASAKIGTHFRKAAIDAYKAANGLNEVTKEQRATIEASVKLDPESDEYRKVKASIQAEMVKAINEGTLGVSERAPRVDPFTAEVNAIVKREVISTLRGAGLHSSKKDPTDETVYTFTNGDRTFKDLKASWLAKNEQKVHKEATANIKAKERAVEKAREAAAKGKDMEALGF